MSVIYFVEADNGLIKIGFAQHLYSRLATLASENACGIKLLGAIPRSSAQAARELRQQFAAYLDHGEWFKGHAALRAYIAQRSVLPLPARGTATPPLEGPPFVNARVPLLEPLLTVEQLAAYLGVSVITIRRHARNRLLPCIRVGGLLRFDATAPEIVERRRMYVETLA